MKLYVGKSESPSAMDFPLYIAGGDSNGRLANIHNHGTPEETQKLANLFASAPDLLEALELALKALIDGNNVIGVITDIEKVISKSKGVSRG